MEQQQPTLAQPESALPTHSLTREDLHTEEIQHLEATHKKGAREGSRQNAALCSTSFELAHLQFSAIICAYTKEKPLERSSRNSISKRGEAEFMRKENMTLYAPELYFLVSVPRYEHDFNRAFAFLRTSETTALDYRYHTLRRTTELHTASGS